MPRASRDRVDQAAMRGWRSLSSYVRATILVALVDSIGVLIVALILGVPVAPALAALVFLGAFVPIVGALRLRVPLPCSSPSWRSAGCRR